LHACQPSRTISDLLLAVVERLSTHLDSSGFQPFHRTSGSLDKRIRFHAFQSKDA